MTNKNPGPGPNKVITLISPVKKRKLKSTDIDIVTGAMEAIGIPVIGNKWLAMSEACDIFFTRGTIDQVKKLLAKLLYEENVDFIVQNAARRKKKLLVSDMDSTIITIECIDELADYMGIKEKVAEITERAMNGELDFKAALRERVALLAGMSQNILDLAVKERLKYMPGARELVKTMRKNGAFCLLVSGGFTYFTNKVRESLNFDKDEANNLEIAGGKLTGKVIEPILDKDAKKNFLEQYMKKLGLEKADTLAVGDGANDLPMLLSADLGIAYHAKKMVRDQANQKIDVCDLTSLLYAQGYHSHEIVNY